MKYTQEQWEHYAKMDDALDEFAGDYVYEATGVGYSINEVFIDTQGNTIVITYDDSCMGCTSQGYTNAPLHYLWSDDWREEYRIAKEEEASKKKQEAAKRTLLREQEKEEKDKELYLELKERFE